MTTLRNLTTLRGHLDKIKKQDFTIIIDRGAVEMHFYYDKKDKVIVARNSCQWFPDSEYYEIHEIDKIIHLYGENVTIKNICY